MQFESHRTLTNFWHNDRLTANIETPEILTSPVCLSFWYSVPHKKSNLRVLVRSADNVTQLLWSHDNAMSNAYTFDRHWQEQNLYIEHNIPFTVRVKKSLKKYMLKLHLTLKFIFSVVSIDKDSTLNKFS